MVSLQIVQADHMRLLLPQCGQTLSPRILFQDGGTLVFVGGHRVNHSDPCTVCVP